MTNASRSAVTSEQVVKIIGSASSVLVLPNEDILAVPLDASPVVDDLPAVTSVVPIAKTGGITLSLLKAEYSYKRLRLAKG